MPIKGLSEQNRLPRLGKIRLGIKVNSKCPKCDWEGFSEGEAPHCPLCAAKVTFKTARPKATSYFVCPPEVKAVYGDEPTELDIMFPLNDLESFASQWLRAYSQTQGLVCIGDGQTCERKVDIKTGAMANHDTPEGGWEKKKDIPCNPKACPEYTTKKCKGIMNLMVLLPKVPGGMGVWQIDTGSVFGIIAINSMARLLLSLTGRCSFIPLKLKLGPRPVSPPGMKKKTVHTMYVEVELNLTELALMAQQAPAQVLLPPPDLTEVEATFYSPEQEEEEESETAAAPPVKAEEIEAIEHGLDKDEEALSEERGPGTQATAPLFENWGQLAEAALKLGISPSKVMARAQKKRWTDFPSFADAWQVVEELVNEKDKTPKML